MNERRGGEKATLCQGQSWLSVNSFEIPFPEAVLLPSYEFCLGCNQLGPELQAALEFSRDLNKSILWALKKLHLTENQ